MLIYLPSYQFCTHLAECEQNLDLHFLIVPDTYMSSHIINNQYLSRRMVTPDNDSACQLLKYSGAHENGG